MKKTLVIPATSGVIPATSSVIPAKAGIHSSIGLTLIELLLSLTLSIFLMSFLFSIYLYAHKIFNLQSELTSLTENQRILSEILTKEIQAAGSVSKMNHYFVKPPGVLYETDANHKTVALIDHIKNFEITYDVIEEGESLIGVSICYTIAQNTLTKKGFLYVAFKN